jgi:hypothetical protein
MAELKRVDASHVEDVHSLLLEFRNPRVTEDQWRSLFENRWSRDEGYAGYALTDQAKVVGFLGYLFSEREIRGRSERFCNLTSWIVKPEYRSESLKLVFPASKLREHTVTNLTPRPEVSTILARLGFQELESGVRVLPPFSLRRSERCRVILDKAEIERSLAGPEARLFRDHQSAACGHLLLQDGVELCYLIHTKRQYRGIRFTHVQHVSRPDVLARNVDSVRGKLARVNGTPVTMIDRRFLRAETLPGSFAKSYPAPMMFRSSTVQREDIDNLYSELVLLRV